uniref:BBX transcription factor n=1 Tax=Oxybasis rubra TaxID=3560 RepID=A0A9E6MS26_OXYRB|nr:BBX transcription factor [Oxybasis rubra]
MKLNKFTNMAEISNRNCELCNGEASLYCPSDNAFLCYSCDSKVHCANFLVARHVRSLICPNCRKTDGNRFSGAVVPPPATVFCRDCSDFGEEDDDSLSSSSSCISSTGEAAAEEAAEMSSSSSSRKRVKVDVRRRERGATVVVDLKVEGVLVNWCKRMGVVEEREYGQVVNMAVELLSGCLDGITVWPFRVSLAASFWMAVRVCCRGGGAWLSSSLSTCQYLRRVEQISGVPAKLILATEAKLARVIKRRRSREDHEEGWAEC